MQEVYVLGLKLVSAFAQLRHGVKGGQLCLSARSIQISRRGRATEKLTHWSTAASFTIQSQSRDGEEKSESCCTAAERKIRSSRTTANTFQRTSGHLVNLVVVEPLKSILGYLGWDKVCAIIECTF